MKPPHQRVFTALVLTCVAFFLPLGAGTAHAADGDFVWAKAMGGMSEDVGHSVSVDAAGNVYTTGSFTGTSDLDPGVGIFNLTSTGNSDIFVSKLDAIGNFIWAKSMGGTDFDFGVSLAVDAAGNLYTTGGFGGTADFDPGVGIFNLTSTGNSDIFVSKLDVNGNLIWAKAMGGAGYDNVESIVVDTLANVYTTGWFLGTADFDPNSGVFNLISSGSVSTFVSKLDMNGNFVWAKGYDDAAAYSSAVDDSGNVYTTGNYAYTVDFDPGISIFNLTSVGNDDVFLSKLDANGNFIWAKTIGGPGAYCKGFSVAMDPTGNLITTGYFSYTVDFDPGLGVSNITVQGNKGSFISKMDEDGNFIWAKAIDGFLGDTIGNSVSVDTGGNIYITGLFQGNVDFDPGTGVFDLISSGGYAVFTVKLENSGNFVWAKSINTGSTWWFDEAASAVDNSGNAFITGWFYGISDFDPDAGVLNIGSAGAADIFVSKLSGPPDTTPPTFTPITASPHFVEVGQTVTITFTASEPLQANPTVTINTNAATFSSVNGLTYEYTYTVTGADTLGAATIEVTGQDISGNNGTESNNTSLMLVAAGAVPLAAWPGIIALAAAGVMLLQRKRTSSKGNPC